MKNCEKRTKISKKHQKYRKKSENVEKLQKNRQKYRKNIKNVEKQGKNRQKYRKKAKMNACTVSYISSVYLKQSCRNCSCSERRFKERDRGSGWYLFWKSRFKRFEIFMKYYCIMCCVSLQQLHKRHKKQWP